MRRKVSAKLHPEDLAEDYHALLGVAEGASPAQVRAAFRRAAKAHHPDVGGDTAAMRRLNRAREVLEDQATAQAYLAARRVRETTDPIVRHGDLMVVALRRFRAIYVDKAAYRREGGIWYREEEGAAVAVGAKLPAAARGCPRPWDRKRLLWDEAWRWALEREGAQR